jgi:glyoxylate reductase
MGYRGRDPVLAGGREVPNDSHRAPEDRIGREVISVARVFIARRVPDNALELLRAAGHTAHVHQSELAPTRAELLAGARGSHALITLLSDRVDDELLDVAGEQLRIVANFAVGIDNIDLRACARRGVLVANTPDVLTDATADQALMLMLAVARRAREGHDLVASGAWNGWHPLQLLGRDLAGATLGILGMGRIGLAVARRALAFGMRILYHNRKRRPEAERELGAGFRPDLDAFIAESDFVSLHAPLTEATRHIIDSDALARMRPHAVLVNTARGALIDERALVRTLAAGRLWGAGLDVFEEEPDIAEGLAALPNVLLAPHLGSATERTRGEMARLCAEAIISALEGRRPANLVARTDDD